MISIEFPHPFLPFPAPPKPMRHTLHSSLRTSSRQRSHCPDHEILEQQILVTTSTAPIMTEIRDLIGLAVTNTLERRIERATGSIESRCRGGEGADRHRAAWQGPQQRARGVCEGSHRWERSVVVNWGWWSSCELRNLRFVRENDVETEAMWLVEAWIWRRKEAGMELEPLQPFEDECKVTTMLNILKEFVILKQQFTVFLLYSFFVLDSIRSIPSSEFHLTWWHRSSGSAFPFHSLLYSLVSRKVFDSRVYRFFMLIVTSTCGKAPILRIFHELKMIFGFIRPRAEKWWPLLLTSSEVCLPRMYPRKFGQLARKKKYRSTWNTAVTRIWSLRSNINNVSITGSIFGFDLDAI